MEIEEYYYTNVSRNISDCDILFSDIELGLVITRLVFSSLAVPLTVLSICALLLEVEKDNVAPVYLINLLFCDLIQLCYIILRSISSHWLVPAYSVIYSISVMANVGFMMCISVERYLVIACPVWYRFRRSIKVSVMVCVVVWLFPVILVTVVLFTFFNPVYIFLIFLLLPFPVLIFSLVGTLRSLSGVTSVSSDEKRRIVRTLVLVLVNYTLLFLPFIILTLMHTETFDSCLTYIIEIFIMISPFSDLFLYVLMGKEATKKLLAFVCRKNRQ